MMLLKEDASERGANDASENSLFSILFSLFAGEPPIEPPIGLLCGGAEEQGGRGVDTFFFIGILFYSNNKRSRSNTKQTLKLNSQPAFTRGNSYGFGAYNG